MDNLSGKDFRGLIYTYLAEAAELAAAGGEEVDIDLDSDALTPAQKKRKHLLNDASLPAAKKAVTEARLEKGVITARPEKGKHVECTTLRTHGFDLDLLSLRSNAVLNRSSELSACDDATEDEELLLLAHEDAHLRDFTVCALFYNINTGTVEDFVGVRFLPPYALVAPGSADPLSRAPRIWRKASFDALLHGMMLPTLLHYTRCGMA